MFLTQLSLKQLIKQVLPFFIVIGKGLKKAYNFLVLRSGSMSEDDKLLNAGMEEMPDLSDIGKAKTKAKGTTHIKGQEDDEDEESGKNEPVDDIEDEPGTKRVIFFDEEDFQEDEEPETQERQAQPESEEITLQPQQSIKTELPSFPGANDEIFELTGGKPGGYKQLNLFDTGERKSKPASDGKRPAPVKNYHYKLPPLSLLKGKKKDFVEKPTRDYSKILEETLGNFGVTVRVINSVRGPTVTRYELQPAKGVKVSKITNLASDIALALAAYSIRIEAPIPGKSAIGIEVPNHHIDPVFLRDILYEARYKKRPVLSLAFGKDITGKPIMGDLLKMPHLLIAGATGSGKSVCINSIIASILYKATPMDVQMMMVDPKRVELSLFEGIPHLLDIKSPTSHKIITDPKIATLALKTISDIMDTRYEDFVALKVRNIKEYNEKAEEKIPYIVIVIDELADLMMISSSTVEQHICRIAQLGRASGIHLILATQRPSVDVITGLIKANVPSRIAFAVSSQVDSRTILDRVGAEKLLGKGDMLYLPVDASEPRRIQGVFVSGEEIEKVVEFWKKQPPPENIIPIVIEESPGKGKGKSDDEGDELLPDAIEIIKMTRQASVSNLQRKMKIGYARAGRIMDQLENRGVVGPAQGSKPRKILLPGYTSMD
ncbi:MAG: DNA translocase FtsK [Candidatus Eremiobacteraeota bacterium]|nr:DNA translocase FtsK [Candidatus Eremiobacteraeota bacterium]